MKRLYDHYYIAAHESYNMLMPAMVKNRAFMMEIPGFIEFIFISSLPNLLLFSHFKHLHIMGTELTKQGGGKYSVPAIEVIEITAEKGFSASNGTSNPGGPVAPMSYDGFSSDDSNEY